MRIIARIGNPDSPRVCLFLYFYAGKTSEAIILAETEVKKSDRQPGTLGMLAYFNAKSGRRAEAAELVKQLKPEAAKQAELLLDLSLIAYALGRKDESFEYFQKAYEKKLVRVTSFRNDPAWKELHADLRFVKLVEE